MSLWNVRETSRFSLGIERIFVVLVEPSKQWWLPCSSVCLRTWATIRCWRHAWHQAACRALSAALAAENLAYLRSHLLYQAWLSIPAPSFFTIHRSSKHLPQDSAEFKMLTRMLWRCSEPFSGCLLAQSSIHKLKLIVSFTVYKSTTHLKTVLESVLVLSAKKIMK